MPLSRIAKKIKKYTHTHTQLFYKIKNWQREKNNIGNKAGILQYALLNIHARDG